MRFNWCSTTPNSHDAWPALRGAVFFGLATGFLESAIILFRQHVLHRFVWTPPFHIWAAPAIYALLFGGLAFGLVALHTLGLRVARRATPYVFAFLGAFILTLPFGQLARIAAMVLALGIAVQIGRAAEAHAAGYQRLTSQGSALLSVLVVVLALALPLSASTLEHWRRTRLGAARPDSPNVIFIILDTVRAASLRLYGNPLPTSPQLERIAREGVVFDRAISPSSWTLPAHASFLTGRWVHELDVNFKKPLNRSQTTLTEVMRDHGYETGAFVGNDRYTFRDSGLTPGFIRYDDYLFTVREVLRSPVLMQTTFFRGLLGVRSARALLWRVKEHDFRIPAGRWGQRKNADLVNRNFLEWASAVRQRPFFAFLNYYDAHYPHRCPPPFRAQFHCEQSKSNAYHGSIAYLDAQLGTLFTQLRQRGLLRNAIVIVTSDHGEQLGERGLSGHGNSLYMPTLHVPLVMWWPGHIPAGVRVRAPVTLRNLPATVLDLAGISGTRPLLPGSSLAMHWSPASATSLSDVGTGTIFSQIVSAPYRVGDEAGGVARISAIEGDRQYILSEGAREELYPLDGHEPWPRDLKRLPHERQALVRARSVVAPIARAQGAGPKDVPTGAGVAAK